MFHDIVSTLSLSPTATSQLTFYWRRLKGEQFTRKLSAVMAVLLVVLQVSTVIAPPDAANASDNNSVVPGGIHPRTKQAVIDEYTGNKDFRLLLNKYGIRKVDLTNANVSTERASNHALLSFGRAPNKADIDSVVVNGITYYIRPLYKSAVQGDNAVFDVLEGRRHGDNKYFAVIFDCGNPIVTDLTPSTETAEIVSGVGNVPDTPGRAPLTGTPVATPQPAEASPIPPEIPNRAPIPVIIPQPVYASTPTATAPNIVANKTGLLSRLDGTKVDANGSTAIGGETITYTLKTANTGGTVKKANIVTDVVTDILQYADIIDAGGATLSNGKLIWPSADISAGATQVNSFSVKIKDPIPATPASPTDPQSFDLKIQNIYHDVVITNLEAPTAAKQVEVASATLPQTGPGLGTVMVFLFAGLIGYFYFRNRQLVTEISLLRSDYQGYGGDEQ
jgi:hypothetical protein